MTRDDIADLIMFAVGLAFGAYGYLSLVQSFSGGLTNM